MSTPRLGTSATAIRASVFADLAPRIEAHAARGGDLIPLHIGDTHHAPPPGARFGPSLGDAEDAALYRYGAITGEPALRRACAAWLEARGQGAVDPDREVLLGVGATHALYCAARAILDPGDEVLVAAPYWPLAVGVVRAAGGVPVEVPLTTRLWEDPSRDAGALFEARLTPRTRALYLISPNNPDGAVLSPAQLASIARVARERDLWVLSDEVYADHVYEGAHASIVACEGMEARTVRAFSLSKSHALAGARVGFVTGPEALVRTALRVATHTAFNVPVASQRVALAALAAGTAWVDALRDAHRDARDAAVAALTGAPVRFHRPAGGSYLFVDFAPWLGDRPLRALLERAIDQGVLLAPGEACGAGYERWARLCYTAVPEPRLLEGIARLRAAME